MNRRTLAALLAATALTACAGQTAAQIGQQAATDAALIATGLENFLSMAQGVPPATAAKITTENRNATTSTAALATAVSSLPSKPDAGARNCAPFMPSLTCSPFVNICFRNKMMSRQFDVGDGAMVLKSVREER